VSRESKVWHSSRIEKNKSKSRSTADTASSGLSKRNRGDWKPELPPWQNTTLLPLPATRVIIDSKNAISSEAFMANISSVHILPTIANAALSDAQLWGKMMLNARLVDQPYIKHKVGWKDGHRDRDMEDEDSEEQISDEDGGVEIRDGNDEEGIKDEHSEEDISDEDGGVKIEDANDEADIKNKIPEAEEMNEASEVEVSDVERSRDKAKREEAMAQRQQTKAKRRREQAKRIRQRSLRWLSSARLSKGFGPV